MSLRKIMTALLMLVLPIVARGAENEDFNPYKNSKVGDSATYKINTKVAGNSIPGTITQTVTAKNEKDLTLKVLSSVSGMEIAGPPQTVDLTKPYDPTKGLPPGFEGTVKKNKDGKEKVKVLGKDYDANWTSYDVEGKIGGMDIKATIKVWFSKEVILGVARVEMTAELKSPNMEVTKLEMTMEPTEIGTKK